MLTLCCLQVLLQLALQGEHGQERAAAVKAIQAFCMANPEGQLALLSDLLSSVAFQARGEHFIDVEDHRL